jgi:hypothetical protein
VLALHPAVDVDQLLDGAPSDQPLATSSPYVKAAGVTVDQGSADPVPTDPSPSGDAAIDRSPDNGGSPSSPDAVAAPLPSLSIFFADPVFAGSAGTPAVALEGGVATLRLSAWPRAYRLDPLAVVVGPLQVRAAVPGHLVMRAKLSGAVRMG